MEVEIKLALPDKAAHAKVLEAFAPEREHFVQQNYFFDTKDARIGAARRSLRVRFYDDNKAVLTIKGRQEMKNGIGRATEVESDLPLPLARRAVQEPNVLLTADSEHLRTLQKEIGFEELVCLGTFKTNRHVFDWEGHMVEVDETIYSPTQAYPTEDTFYEIELETEEPEKVKEALTAFLKQKDIPFSDGLSTKFGRFRKRAKIVEAEDSKI
mmetsp:Transcript_10939/g.32783  ORF Transcript_10939/g.32783 Transcript_10939/m.32783 type:complete len:212 (+) Transcript_10939:470-1105(+)